MSSLSWLPPLTTMVAVGSLTPRRARLWMCLPAETRLTAGFTARVQLHSATGHQDLSVSPSRHDAASNTALLILGEPGNGELRPSTRYEYSVAVEGVVLGSGRFKTPADRKAVGAGTTTLAFSSCFQPYHPDGSVRDESRQMLQAAREIFQAESVDLWLAMGDQLYSDLPAKQAIFRRDRLQGVSEEQLVERFHQRYRSAWNLKEWLELYRLSACLPVIDDHDIVDNYGSYEIDGSPEVKAAALAALRCFGVWQGQRAIDGERAELGPFDHGFRYGPVAGYAPDLRSERRVVPQGRLLGEEQLARFDRHFAEHSDAEVFVVVLSQPILAAPPRWVGWLSKVPAVGGDFADRLSNPSFQEGREALLERIHALAVGRPRGSVLVLAGDIHVGAALELEFPDGTRVPQIVSSALATCEGWVARKLAATFLGLGDGGPGRVLERSDVKLATGLDAAGDFVTPYSGLNLGCLSVAEKDGQVIVEAQLFTHDQGRPSRLSRVPLGRFDARSRRNERPRACDSRSD